ncbi:MAG: T9SS type A sorting domain-containing protein [Bacteroidia bacterium]|jgi:ELWxxDGT repeat protein
MKKLVLASLWLFYSIALFAQPVLLKDLDPKGWGNPTGFTAFNGKVYFNATTPDTTVAVPDFTQKELWVTDGTDTGTKMVYDLHADVGGSVNPYGFTVAGSKLFFIGEVSGGYQLFTSDGTSAGTKVVITASYPNALNASDKDNLMPFGNNIVLRAIESASNNAALFLTNGTVAGTKRLATIMSPPQFKTQYGILNGNLYLTVGFTDQHGLIKTNGTAAGTVEVCPMRSAAYSNLINYKGVLYFLGDTSAAGDIELWKTDGTLNGTTRVKDIQAGNTGSVINIQILEQDSLYFYFTADDGIHGNSLWRSDGTSGGTQMIKDLRVDGYLVQDGLIRLNAKILFSAQDSATGFYTIWSTDGSVSGTTLLIDSTYSSIIPQIKNFAQAGKDLLIGDGDVIYKTDGTQAGTSIETTCDLTFGPKFIGEMCYLNEKVYLSIFDTAYGNELYVYNFTPTGNTGLSQLHNTTEELQVVPNPFSESFKLEGVSETIRNFTVTDLLGRVVFEQAELQSGELVSFGGHHTGLYLYFYTAKDGQWKSGKLVKN